MFSITATAHSADVIPSERRYDWASNAGVSGGIQQYIAARTNLIDVTQSPYSADNTGTNDVAAAVQSAINAASANDVVYFPAGTYRFDSGVSVANSKDNITIRGAGASQVTFDARHTGGSLIVVGSSDSQWYDPANEGTAITAEITAGATSITMADTSALGGVGAGAMLMIVCEDDNDLPVLHVDAYNYSRGFKAIVTAIDSTTVTFAPAIPYSVPLSLNPLAIARPANRVVSRVGVEGITIDGTNSTGGVVFVQFSQTSECWAYDLVLRDTNNRFIKFEDSSRGEVRRLYGTTRKGEVSGPNGAGILADFSASLRIEDNFLHNIFPSVEMNFGASGCYVAYNVFGETVDSEGDLIGVSLDTNHGPHNSFNLYEGNIALKIQSDGYYGSASHDTIFRNWVHATSAISTERQIAIELNRFSRYYNIVGNIVGASGTSWTRNNTGHGWYGTSTSSVSVDTGNKTFTTQSGLSIIGDGDTFVKIHRTSDPSVWMKGLATAYSGSSLTVNVSSVSGSGTFTDWTIRAGRGYGNSENKLFSWGMPNIGNGSFTGMAEHSAGDSWSDWAEYLVASPGSGPDAGGFQELDLDVFGTALIKGNYNYATNSIPLDESLGSDTIPDSYFYDDKPEYFGNLAWPPFEPTNPGTPSLERIPAGYRFVNGEDPPPEDEEPSPAPSLTINAGTVNAGAVNIGE